jgi:Kef-type K+ transport system membrane component KefB
MLLDLGFLASNPLLVLAAAGVVTLVKILTTTGSVLVLGYPMRIAAATGLAPAQIGEFSFVLERAGRAAGLSPAGLLVPSVRRKHSADSTLSNMLTWREGKRFRSSGLCRPILYMESGLT